jgi:predicted site-specific integrase-resolvase
MNKDDAAKVLGVSTKTVVNYAMQGLLKTTYIKGKTRPVADYDANEVHELKAKIDSGDIQIEKRETGIEKRELQIEK